MESVSLQKLAKAAGSACGDDIIIRDICTDTRNIKEGSLFVALRGERFDGHAFIEQAYEKGAAGVVTEIPISGHPGVILVKDTVQALLDIAGYYRSLFRVFVAGVTGSVGKTSTKEMIYAILSAKGKTLKTEGNQNNQIGMPLTLLGLNSGYDNAVIEMGMSGFGEIASMSKSCRPSVGIITNIGVSHMETLGSQENIRKAKLEIMAGMPSEAPLILNGDDMLLRAVNDIVDRPVIYYGIKYKDADISASDIVVQDGETSFTIHYYGQEIPASIKTIGRHNVYNALAGFCTGIIADMQPEMIVSAMRVYKNTGMRQNISQKNGITIISDCYNASPDSMRAAVDVLLSVKCSGKRICVLGDMLELGMVSEESHIEVGKLVGRSNVDLLLCYGEQAKDIKRGAIMVGMKHAYHFAQKEELADYLLRNLREGDTVIFKASRGIQLEEVIRMVEEEIGK